MTRQPSKIDELSNAWVVKLAELSPSFATYAGFAGGEDKLDDNSPAAIKHYYELEKEMLAKLEALEPVDAIDEVSKAALAARASVNLVLECMVFPDLKCVPSESPFPATPMDWDPD